MLRFFLSIKTSLWLCGICIVICVVGSYAIPQHLDVFSEINDMPLFRWLELNTGELGASYWIYALIAWGLVALGGVVLLGQESTATLSEVQRLKGELHQAKVALIQTQAQLANCTAQAEVARLTTERLQLETEFRATLTPPTGAVFDWQTLTFKPKPEK